MCLLDLLLLDLPLIDFALMLMVISFNLRCHSLTLSSHFSGFDFLFNCFISHLSNLLEMLHLNLIQISSYFTFFSLIIHFRFGFTTSNFLNFLLQLSSSLFYSQSSIGNLTPFFVCVFFSFGDVIFSPLQFTLVSSTNFGNKRGDVACGVVNLLRQFIDLHPLL